MTRRHVVLLTYGEPPRARFVDQLRYSWRILLGLTRTVAKIPAPLLPMIAVLRARTRVRLWSNERFESPLEPLSQRQANGLAEALAATAPAVDWQVHVAYEFRDPLLTDLIASLPADEPVDVIPMYAADSAFTHQLARDTIAQWQKRRAGRAAPVSVLPPLATEVQAELSVRHLRRALRAAGLQTGSDWVLVLAAHGTLVSPPRPYETGRQATEDLAAAITARLRGEFGRVTLGWLNHVYGGRWTEPAADVALREAAEAGFRNVVYFPFGFLADNAESQLEGTIALRTQPGLSAVHIPCLNDSDELATAFARQVVDAMATAETEWRDDAGGANGGANGAGRDGHANGTKGSRRLHQLEPGEKSVVLRVEGEHGIVRRLMEYGLVPGTAIEMIRRAPLGDPLEVRFRHVSFSIRKSQSTGIHIA